MKLTITIAPRIQFQTVPQLLTMAPVEKKAAIMYVHTHFSFLDLSRATSPCTEGCLNLMEIAAPFTILYENKLVSDTSFVICSTSRKKTMKLRHAAVNQAALVATLVYGFTYVQNWKKRPSLAMAYWKRG